eukprot:m.98584 g.98584  ORF g.98584 m.98584 type:complete len:138 (-) comp20578_c0_seq2:170-583(-)
MATCSGFISCTSTAYSGFISRSNTPTAYSRGVLYDHHEQDLDIARHEQDMVVKQDRVVEHVTRSTRQRCVAGLRMRHFLLEDCRRQLTQTLKHFGLPSDMRKTSVKIWHESACPQGPKMSHAGGSMSTTRKTATSRR